MFRLGGGRKNPRLENDGPEQRVVRDDRRRKGGEARHLAAALQLGDAAARRILDETAGDLAFGLSHAAHLFHPEAIVIGGGLGAVGEPLRAAVEAALDGFLMDAFKPGPRVLLSGLGDDVVPVGALLLAGAGTV